MCAHWNVNDTFLLQTWCVLLVDTKLLVALDQMLAFVTKGSSFHWTSHSSQQVRVKRSISAIMVDYITSVTGRLMHESLFVY
jgi:hypothetical protein